jgi:hypothetical protein
MKQFVPELRTAYPLPHHLQANAAEDQRQQEAAGELPRSPRIYAASKALQGAERRHGRHKNENQSENETHGCGSPSA